MGLLHSGLLRTGQIRGAIPITKDSNPAIGSMREKMVKKVNVVARVQGEEFHKRLYSGRL